MNLLQFAPGKLDNPIMMRWALHSYENACARSDGTAQEMEKAWFDDLTLRKWLDLGDRNILTTTFRILPPEVFENLKHTVAERWKTWQGSLAFFSAPVLMILDPAEIVDLFTDHVDRDLLDVTKTSAVIKYLASLPEEPAHNLFRKIDGLTRKIQNHDSAKNSLLAQLVEPTISFAHEGLPILVGILAQSLGVGKNDSSKFFGYISRRLFGGNVFYDQAQALLSDGSGAMFRTLEMLFEAGAPLADFDMVVSDAHPVALALPLLEAHAGRSEKIKLAIKIFESTVNLEQVNEADLACFAVAAVASAYELQDLDVSAMSLDDALNIICLDLPEVPHHNTLVTHLQKFDPAAVTEAVNKRLPEVRHEWGGIHLVAAAGELRLEGAVSVLVDSLCRECNDLLCERSSAALVRIGVVAQSAIIERWDNLDSSQKIFGHSVVAKVGGERVLDFAFQRFNDLFNEFLEQWCILAETFPDVRTIKLLEPELHRAQTLIDETFYRLCVLTGTDHERLNEIRDRVQDNHREQEERLAAFEHGTLNRETVTLLLRCVECGDLNKYDVKDVVLSGEIKEYPHILADEFPCASCGKWSEFEFTSEAIMAVIAHMLMFTKNTGDGNVSIPVRLINVTAQGEKLPAPMLMARLKSAVADNPDGIEANLRLGRMLHIFKRPQAARKCYERVLSKEPNAMEAGLGLAKVLSDTGKKKEAYNVVCALLARKSSWRFFRVDEMFPTDLGTEFALFHNELMRSLGIQDRPLLHERFIGNPSKVGRNDPCPCGSGKKFKRCCLK